MWPSKNPDDYVAAGPRLGVPSDADLPQPPYWVLISLSLAGAGVVVALAAAVGGLRPSHWIWTVVASTWVGRSQVARWWADTHGDRAVSWRPAGAFALAAVLIGVASAPLLDGRHDRALVIYMALVVAWSGSDLLDWLLRRHSVANQLSQPE